MAGDLTMDACLRFKGKAYTEQFLLDTASGTTIYKGTPMMIDQGSDTTHVVPFVDAFHGAATDVCVGIAAENKVTVTSDPETAPINVYTWPSIVGFVNTTSALTNADIGKTMYFSGSGLLSETATDNAQVGKLFTVEDGYAFVQLSTPQVCASTG
jgi:hypothetical protein